MSFYAGPGQGALAFVESPAQLLNVIELARHEDDLTGVKIAVLAPSAGLTRNQLQSMVTLGREAGHTISWHEPRLGGMAVARSVRALAGQLSGRQRLIVGDPYSGVIQVIIGITPLSEVTIVDDGTATLEFAVSGWPASTSPDGISGQLPASGDRLPCSRGSKLQESAPPAVS